MQLFSSPQEPIEAGIPEFMEKPPLLGAVCAYMFADMESTVVIPATIKKED